MSNKHCAASIFKHTTDGSVCTELRRRKTTETKRQLLIWASSCVCLFVWCCILFVSARGRTEGGGMLMIVVVVEMGTKWEKGSKHTNVTAAQTSTSRPIAYHHTNIYNASPFGSQLIKFHPAWALHCLAVLYSTH